MHRIRLSVRENRLLNPALVQPEDYRLMLNERGRGWVAELDAQVAGFAVADRSRSNVWALFVAPDFERRGIGRALHDTMFDRDLIALRGKLAAIACSAGSPEDIEPELRGVLEEAMPVYRRRWWPGHHAANTAWIRSRLGELKSHEAALAGRLAQAYGGEWPPERIRVDVVAYANWSGAYTTNRPNHVILSSPSYDEGLEGLEILFHEVSHASFFEQRILGQLAAAFRQHGAEPSDRLSHVIQFITPPELLRVVLGGEKVANYRSIAERVHGRGGSLSDEYKLVLEHWRPFLEGKIQRAEALDRIAAELAPRKKTE